MKHLIIILTFLTATSTLFAGNNLLLNPVLRRNHTNNTNAIRIAKARGVRGTILNAQIHKDRDGVKKLFAVSTEGAYYFKFNGEYYQQQYSRKLNSLDTSLRFSGFADINNDGYAEFYFSYKRGAMKTLMVYNFHGMAGMPITHTITSNNGIIRKSATLVSAKKIARWMETKIAFLTRDDNNNNNREVSKLDPNQYTYLCDISTDGTGSMNRYRVGGKYCALPISKLTSDIVFQKVYGPVRYITAHERFSNGTWRTTYEGALKTLRLYDIRKTNSSTSIIFSVNGKHEKYLPLKSKVRVYVRKTTQSHRLTLPTLNSARTILHQRARLKRYEKILGIFVYEENSKATIAALTTRAVYRLIDSRGDWYVEYKYMIKRRKVTISEKNNGIADADRDRVKDLYFTTIDRKGYKILNIVSFNKRNGVFSAFAKVSEAIGDFDPEVEFKFSKKTPQIFKHWMKTMIYRLGFVQKPREIIASDPKMASHKWVRDNRFLHLSEEKALRVTYYKGDRDTEFVSRKGFHPVISTANIGGIVYRAHYKGMVTAYDKRNNRSYIVWLPKITTNFVTTIYNDGGFIFFGLQNSGVIRLDTNSLVLKHFYPRALQNRDIWKIERRGKFFYFTVDGNNIRLKARLFTQKSMRMVPLRN